MKNLTINKQVVIPRYVSATAPLIGTQSQTVWASRIRADMLHGLNRYLHNKVTKGKLTSAQEIELLTNKINAEIMASFWINHRNSFGYSQADGEKIYKQIIKNKSLIS